MIILEKNIKIELEEKFLNEKKSHQDMNILNYDKIDFKKIQFEKFDEIELNDEKFIIYRDKNKKSRYMIEFDNIKIILRDLNEKRFMIEKYLEKEFKNSNEKSFKEFYEKSNFIKIQDREFQLLDYLDIDIKKKKIKKIK